MRESDAYVVFLRTLIAVFSLLSVIGRPIICLFFLAIGLKHYVHDCREMYL